MDLQSTKPFIGQKGIFYGNKIADYEPEGVPCVVCKVWSDTCVNLALNNGNTPTSVFVWTAGSQKPGGYWCELEAPQTMVQPKLTGYRELSNADVALMNTIKHKGTELQQLIDQVLQHVNSQRDEPGAAGEAADERHKQAQPHRWLAMARTDLQTGLGRLQRAIAQPTTF